MWSPQGTFAFSAFIQHGWQQPPWEVIMWETWVNAWYKHVHCVNWFDISQTAEVGGANHGRDSRRAKDFWLGLGGGAWSWGHMVSPGQGWPQEEILVLEGKLILALPFCREPDSGRTMSILLAGFLGLRAIMHVKIFCKLWNMLISYWGGGGLLLVSSSKQKTTWKLWDILSSLLWNQTQKILSLR